MARKYLLFPAGLLLFLALIWSPGPGTDPSGAKTDKVVRELEGEGPWAVWVFFRDKGLEGQALESALDEAESRLLPRTARRRAKMSSPTGRLVDAADLSLHEEYLTGVRETGASPRQVSRWLNAASYTVTREQADRLARLDFVERMELVQGFRRAAIPEPVGKPIPLLADEMSGKSSTVGSLDYGSNLDAMVQVNVPPLHDEDLTGKGVLVGMLDTGFRTTHEALAGLPVLATWDFVDNDPIVDEEVGDPVGSRNHGTMTLSTVAGNKSGSLIGPAPGVSVVLARTEDLGQEIPLEEDNWVAGLEWVEGLGADIVSSSLSYFDWYDFSDLDGNTAVTTIAADLAVDRGLVVINSAGNNRTSTGTLGAPADGFNVLTVGAVDALGNVAYFSSPGPTYDGRIKPEVAALGVSNTVVSPNDDISYLAASGTSFSCPVTSGVVALMLERVPQLTPLQIIDALKQTASQTATPDNDLGWGIVDAWAAATWYGPVIEHEKLPDTEDTAGPYVVSAVITDRVGVDTGSLNLTYRVNAGPWTSVPLVATGAPDTYSADIPGAPDHNTVEYFLEAVGTNGFATARPYQGPACAYSFTTGPWRYISYSADTPESIPDGVGWGVVSMINVPMVDSGFMLEISVDVDITHPDRGELQVMLMGPDGTQVTLHDHSGTGSADLVGNWTGNLITDGPGSLDDFLELSNKGDWTLEVMDNIPGNSGTLNSWGLNFTLVRYVTGVDDVVPAPVTILGPNVPNPFNPRTEIFFDLARPGQTRLSIFDVRGMLVTNLLNEDLPAGSHKAVWGGTDVAGRSVASGTYFYRLDTGAEIQVRKMLLVR